MSNYPKPNLKKRSGGPLPILIVGILIVIAIGIGPLNFSKFIFFKKEVIGKVISCKSLDAVYAEGNKIFSFSVEIEAETETINFSAEDRKWASVNEGDKVKAVYFVYPPWDLGKAGTFYEGRLIKKLKQ